MTEHGTVDFVEQVLIDVDRELGRDAQEVAIICGVMDLAETETVGHDRFTTRFPVADDMRGIQKVEVFQRTDRTGCAVRTNNSPAEHGLVEAYLDHAVGIPFLGGRRGHPAGQETQTLIQSKDELAVVDVIVDDVGGEYRYVDSFVDLLQENDGKPQFEGPTQFGVVALGGPCAVVVVEQPALNMAVVIRTGGGADNTEGGGKVARVPDPLARVDDAACLAVGEEER